MKITAEQLMVAERAQRYARQLERPEVFPTADNWLYIIENSMGMLARKLYRKFLVSVLTPPDERSEFHRLCLDNFPAYLRAIDRRTAINTIYGDMVTAPEASVGLIVECQLFDATRILTLMNGDLVLTAIACLAAYQPEYSYADVPVMRELAEAVRDLAPIGHIKKVRGLFGGEIKYICADGHSNPADTDFCEVCGRDINGLDRTLRTTADAYIARVATLESLMK